MSSERRWLDNNRGPKSLEFSKNAVCPAKRVAFGSHVSVVLSRIQRVPLFSFREVTKNQAVVFPARFLQNRSQENCFNRSFSFVSSDLPKIRRPIHRSTVSYQYTQDRNITIASHLLAERKGLSAMSVPWLRQSLPRVKQFSRSVVVFTELVAGQGHVMGIVKDSDHSHANHIMSRYCRGSVSISLWMLSLNITSFTFHRVYVEVNTGQFQRQCNEENWINVVVLTLHLVEDSQHSLRIIWSWSCGGRSHHWYMHHSWFRTWFIDFFSPH